MTRLGSLEEAIAREAYVDQPMFVPFGGGQLASVLTLPATKPRGLVLLLQGLGASRSHKNRVWTRTARGLAAHGIASVRMDYPSMGDSTGTLRTGLDDLPRDEVATVASIAMDISGAERLGVIGNCMGLRTGFALASQDERYVGIASILLGSAKPLLRGQGLSSPGRAVKKAGKRWPGAKRAVRQVFPGAHLEQRLRFLPEVEAVLSARGGFFLFFGDPKVTQPFEREAARRVAAGSVPIDVRSVAITGTSGFRVPVTLQPLLIDSVVAWMDRAFIVGGGPS